jgi:hypothetical protein
MLPKSHLVRPAIVYSEIGSIGAATEVPRNSGHPPEQLHQDTGPTAFDPQGFDPSPDEIMPSVRPGISRVSAIRPRNPLRDSRMLSATWPLTWSHVVGRAVLGVPFVPPDSFTRQRPEVRNLSRPQENRRSGPVQYRACYMFALSGPFQVRVTNQRVRIRPATTAIAMRRIAALPAGPRS